MQTANILVAIAGDLGNVVPKFGVTASEIAVLQAIHGNEAVFDIEPHGEVERSNREEIARLRQIYGKNVDGKDTSPVADLFPGAAARAFETIDELGIDETFFKAESRVTAAPKEASNKSAPKEAGKKKSGKKAADDAGSDEAVTENTDDVKDMDGDENLFK